MKLLSLKRLKHIKLADLINPIIDRFVWSAVLDERVCELCKSLDGQVVDSNSPEYTIYQPSLHPRCRCTWVPVKSDAPNIPDVNFEKPSNDLITKYAPFWFLIPDKEKDKKKILPIDDMWYSNEAPELFFNTKDVLSIEQYIYETEQRKIEGDYGQQG